MQVLLEVDQKPREAEDDDEQEIVAQLTQGMMPGGMMGPMGMSGAMGMMMGANAPVDGSLGGYGGGYARTRVSSGGTGRGFALPTVHHAAEAKRRANLGARAKLGSPETNKDGVVGSFPVAEIPLRRAAGTKREEDDRRFEKRRGHASFARGVHAVTRRGRAEQPPRVRAEEVQRQARVHLPRGHGADGRGARRIPSTTSPRSFTPPSAKPA
jgi:hypothetical protein